MKPFSLLEHTSDIGISATGSNRLELYANAAKALCSILYADALPSVRQISVSLDGSNREELLVNWLQEILFLLDTENFLATHVHIDSVTDTSLKGILGGIDLRSTRLRPDHEVKAVTFHRLAITETKGVWSATVYLDL